MNSSTSHSRRRLVVLLICLAAGGTIGWITAAGYTLFLNQEIGFWKQAALRKSRWATQLDQDYDSKTVVIGGSSTAFGINSDLLLEEFDLPVVNAGMHAGMGAAAVTKFGLCLAREGDLVVIALESELLLRPSRDPDLATQFSAALGMPLNKGLEDDTANDLHEALDTALTLRPGGFEIATLIGHVLTRTPIYRYKAKDLSPSGWAQTSWRQAPDAKMLKPDNLDPAKEQLLTEICDYCDRHGMEVVYALPWQYVPDNMADEFRSNAATYLLHISSIMPVLKDPRMGVHGEISDFADTKYHLTVEGASRRTREFAQLLQTKAVWKIEELEQIAGHATDNREPATAAP